MTESGPAAKIVTRGSVFITVRRRPSKISISTFESATSLLSSALRGAAKSTFLRTLNRMNELIPHTHTDGTVLLDERRYLPPGHRCRRPPATGWDGLSRPIPSQRASLKMWPSVLGFWDPFEERDYRNVEQSLKAVALWPEVSDRLHSNALNLTLGQQQRLCIARVIAVQPEVILMDEPCSALDPIATLKIEEFDGRS